MRRVCTILAVLIVSRSAAGDNKLRSSGFDVHDLILEETAEVFSAGEVAPPLAVTTRPAGVRADFPRAEPGTSSEPTCAVYTSRVIRARFPFNEVVPSWNVIVPRDTGFRVELRLGPGRNAEWTAWYYLGTWGRAGSSPEKTVRDDDGEIDIDYFRSTRTFDRLQYRLHFFGRLGAAGPHLRRFAMVCTNALGDRALYERMHRPVTPPPACRWQRRLPVPYRSQQDQAESIRGSVCSPTSISMVMEYRGVKRLTRHMCDLIWDPEYELYGNWARAVQGAFVEGVPGYVGRFGTWDEVKWMIARDQPIIASIRVPPGGLTGSPYRSSAGHLLVVVGFDEKGDVLVNDPAARDAAAGQIAYKADEMKAVWLNNGGVGYVLLAPD